MTPQAEYAAKYATGEIDTIDKKIKDPSKTYCIILCAAVVGLTYPVTRGTDYVIDEKNQNEISIFHHRYPSPIAGQLVAQRADKALKAGFDSHFVAIRVDRGYQVRRSRCW